jgi:prolyl-tRNA synthetase
MTRNALSVTRAEDFSKWFQAAIVEADLAEYSSVRGCMVIKPWGFAIWERMQAILDQKFKETGHENCYFPLFIPIDLFQKEADHVAGFAKEMAIVTHHRLEQKDGRLVPSSPLEVPLAVRPTSEMIIGESFSRWVKSYRDLPIKVNQWANVVRWEMRPRLFLRTSEFLWQEGHTAHATETEAIEEANIMHSVYFWFLTDVMKMFVVKGKKPVHEKFPGAEDTYTIEAMMQDGKALQCATSHFLGQHFAKAVDIRFQTREGSLQYAFTTSWGVTTRLIGAIIMVHGDDDGVNLSSFLAPFNVIIIPLIKNEERRGPVLDYCLSLQKDLSQYRSFVDLRDESPQNKKWNYIRKGAPLICEIGEQEIQKESVSFIKRLNSREKLSMDKQKFIETVPVILADHDTQLFERSKANFDEKTSKNIKNTGELKAFFDKSTGFVFGKWKQKEGSLDVLDELGITIRAEFTSDEEGECLISGEKTFVDAIFAKAY